ncbi:hypothetical protein [Reichenbachiella sp.]|uniref:hypothetical protein n=1 Tax=Reichenbachiella sp. TaxID=2184521 RepID=UPI003B5CB5E6
MKKVIGKYAFEVVVIFIGITTSFLFEEWRQSLEKEAKAIEIMQSLVIELERNHNYMLDIDTGYMELDSAIHSLLVSDSIQREEVAEITFFLMEEIPKFRLKSISSFIHGFSSTDQLHILNRNKKIRQYLSYLEGLLEEHESYTNAISEYSSTHLWPIANKYGVANFLIAEDKEEYEILENSWSGRANKNIQQIKSNQDFITHLKWSRLKIRRLIEINQFIHKHIKNTIRELNIAIEEA